MRRSELDRELEGIRKVQLSSEAHLQAHGGAPALALQELVDYYLDPDTQLVHIFLTLPSYAKEVERVRRKLEIPRRRFDQILKRLLRMGAVELSSGGYRVIRERMHLPADSTLLAPYRDLLRMRSLERARKLSSDDAYTFSVIFSASPKERKWIQAEFLALLKRIERVVGDAKPSEVYQLNFDLLDWSAGE